MEENLNFQIEKLAKSHLNNKKKYSEFSQRILTYISCFYPENFDNTKFNKSIFTEKAKHISTTNNKIRSSIYSIESYLKSINLNQLSNLNEKSLFSNFNSLENEISNISKLVSDMDNELKNNFEDKVSNRIELKFNPIRKFDIIKEENFKKIVFNANEKEIEKILRIDAINNKIHEKTLIIHKSFIKTKDEINELINKISDEKNIEYIERFNEDTKLIIKKFENQIQNLTQKFENQIQSFNLDQDKVLKSSDLLTKNVDNGLKSLNILNEKIQNIELEFSKIVSLETENIKVDLNNSKNSINNKITDIINNVTSKSEAIETAHSDFTNLVKNAGIYNLTENYSKKSEEEKEEYKTYRKYTTYSIIAAIISTLLIFIIAFFEHLFSNNGNETNYLLLASRLSISVMFFVLALYLSKQSSKHYECYQDNHRTFLQLAALEPFMSRMTEEEQKEIRKGLIPSYFNQPSEGKFSTKNDEVGLPESFTAAFEKIIESVKEIKISKNSNKPDGD